MGKHRDFSCESRWSSERCFRVLLNAEIQLYAGSVFGGFNTLTGEIRRCAFSLDLYALPIGSSIFRLLCYVVILDNFTRSLLRPAENNIFILIDTCDNDMYDKVHVHYFLY